MGGSAKMVLWDSSANTSLHHQLLSALRVGFESPLPICCFSSSFPPPTQGNMQNTFLANGSCCRYFFLMLTCQTHDNCIDYLTTIITCLNFPFLLFPTTFWRFISKCTERRFLKYSFCLIHLSMSKQKITLNEIHFPILTVRKRKGLIFNFFLRTVAFTQLENRMSWINADTFWKSFGPISPNTNCAFDQMCFYT